MYWYIVYVQWRNYQPLYRRTVDLAVDTQNLDDNMADNNKNIVDQTDNRGVSQENMNMEDNWAVEKKALSIQKEEDNNNAGTVINFVIIIV